MVYDFEGIDIGIEHEIEVTANGKILEVEQEDENNSAEYSEKITLFNKKYVVTTIDTAEHF